MIKSTTDGRKNKEPSEAGGGRWGWGGGGADLRVEEVEGGRWGLNEAKEVWERWEWGADVMMSVLGPGGTDELRTD